MIKTLSVTDVYGRQVIVNTEDQKLHSFNNRTKEIIYCAEIVEDGQLTGFFTDYQVKGKITNLADKLSMFGNPISHFCAIHRVRKGSKDYKNLLALIEANPDRFFTKSGDWRKSLIITAKDFN